MRVDEIKVIEFGTYLSAPLVGKYLVDAGFEVISIVKPLNDERNINEHEYMKSMLHDLHYGKSRVFIDLKKNIDEAKELIKSCHVLVENFKVGCMKRFGLGYEECMRINPNLIYVSLPGYNSKDDKYFNIKAWDSIVMATSGVFSDMGLNRTLLGVDCSFSGLNMPSVYASLYAASAIVSALFDSSLGRYIEVPLASCLLEALVHNSVEFPLNDSYKNLRQLHIQKKRIPIDQTELATLIDPFFSKYTCSDNRPIYIVCPSHTRHQTTLLDCLGIFDDVYKIISQKIAPYSENVEYHGIGSGRLTQDEANMVRPLIQKAIMTKSSTEWEYILGNNNVPCIAHKSMNEWKETKHSKESGLILDNGRIGPVQWHHVVKSTHTNCQKRFKDLKVIDLTNVIAGPTISAMLARLGTDVIKIDPVHPFYGPTVTIVYGVVVNIGKKSILLDITTPSGRLMLNDIIKESDAIVVNNTNSGLKRIGLTHIELLDINPDIILMHFDAWSGCLEKGEYSNYIGYDDNIQAGIGIMERFGGDLDNVEEHAHIGTIDVIAGVAGNFSLVLALLRRKLDKVITTARTSLASVGQYLQYNFMFDEYKYIGKGIECTGFHALHRYYKTKDGYIMIVANLIREKCKLESLYNEIFGLQNAEKFISSKTSSEIITYIKSFDLEAVKVTSLYDLKKENTVLKMNYKKTYQFVEQCNHPIGRFVIVPPIAIMFEKYTYSLTFAPKYGENTFQILNKYIKTHLLVTGEASTAYSRNYIPYTEKCGKCNSSNAIIQLNCTHKFCHLCMCSAKKHCYICGQMHEMDIIKLRKNVFEWSNAYKLWRKGYPIGSRDIHRILQNESPIIRSRSCPHLKTIFQSTSLTSNVSFCVSYTNDKSGMNA